MMNFNHALAALAKKFAIDSDVLKSCTKQTVVNWGEQVVAGALAEKATGVNTYQLTRHQHAFLIGDYRFIPTNAKHAFEF
jgi:hypothetical protein